MKQVIFWSIFLIFWQLQASGEVVLSGRAKVIRMLTLLVALLAATSSWASSLTLNDTLRILTFKQKLISFGNNDLLVTMRSAYPASANAAECLANLHDNLTIVLGGFAEVSDLAKLVPLMVNPDDEAVVVSELRENIKNFQLALANNRNSVNGFMGICGPSGVVAVKGQELLRLYDEAAALVEVISNKIGR